MFCRFQLLVCVHSYWISVGGNQFWWLRTESRWSLKLIFNLIKWKANSSRPYFAGFSASGSCLGCFLTGVSFFLKVFLKRNLYSSLLASWAILTSYHLLKNFWLPQAGPSLVGGGHSYFGPYWLIGNIKFYFLLVSPYIKGDLDGWPKITMKHQHGLEKQASILDCELFNPLCHDSELLSCFSNYLNLQSGICFVFVIWHGRSSINYHVGGWFPSPFLVLYIDHFNFFQQINM